MRKTSRIRGLFACALAAVLAACALAAPVSAWADETTTSYEASVSVDGGTATNYATLEEAVAAANASTGSKVTLTLLSDAEVTETSGISYTSSSDITYSLNFARSLTIDGGGYTISFKNVSRHVRFAGSSVSVSNLKLKGFLDLDLGASGNASLTNLTVDDWSFVRSGSVTVVGSTFADGVNCDGTGSSLTINSGSLRDIYADGGTVSLEGGSVSRNVNITDSGTVYLKGGVVYGNVYNNFGDSTDQDNGTGRFYICGTDVRGSVRSFSGLTFIQSGTIGGDVITTSKLYTSTNVTHAGSTEIASGARVKGDVENFAGSTTIKGTVDGDVEALGGATYISGTVNGDVISEPESGATAASSDGASLADIGYDDPDCNGGDVFLSAGLVMGDITLAASSKGKISITTGCVAGSVSSNVTVDSTSRAISLDNNNGSSEKGTLYIPTTADMGSVSALYTPVRSGHTFQGWYTAKSGGELIKVFTSISKLEGVSTLYARWDDYEEEPPAFNDVNYELWYGDGVATVAKAGLMKGYGGTSDFGVGKTMTRAELAQILFRASGGNPDATYPANSTGMADVVDGVWYTRAANWAVANKVINGYENADGSHSFGPEDPVTFEQMVKILASHCDAEGSSAHATASLSGFEDASAVDSWAESYIAWAVDKGLVEGYGGKTLAPLEEVARERAATVIARAMDLGLLEVE